MLDHPSSALPDAVSAQASVESYYHLRAVEWRQRACGGLACFAARGDAPQRWADAQREPKIQCLGHCYAAPADTETAADPRIECRAAVPVLLQRIVAGGAANLDTYLRLGGGAARTRALRLAPDLLIDEIERAQLRGRGGAGFPTARKWRAVRAQAGALKVVVANADEGDAGAFSDRLLMERDPLRLIEGLCIAAHAVGATRGIIYLRKEYPQAAEILRAALDAARAAGWLGENFAIELAIGHGSYVCGEETALLNSLEHRRPQARLRSPRVFEHGLFGAPTLVNNVETLCAAAWIVEHGGAAYAQLGFSQSRGTKLLSLNSLFRRPGLYEVEFGMPLREIVEQLGGGLRRGVLRALMVGGPLAAVLPASQLDLRLGFEEMAAAGAAVGHGGVIAFADDSSIAEIAAQIFAFGAAESCGRCVPCHRGTPQLAAMFSAQRGDAPRFAALVDALAQTSLCGHGQGLAEFAHSLQRYFAQELQACCV